MNSALLKNKQMNSQVYKLRREVIALIHEANKLISPFKLPRIEVRVAENDAIILGCAKMGSNMMWITERSVASRGVVFHEILHAVFAVNHVDGCPLMDQSVSKSITDEECDRIFKSYITMENLVKAKIEWKWKRNQGVK